jgi:hypothetical protein
VERYWRAGRIASRDGTTISYLTTGDGAALVVLPGDNRRARHYAALTQHLCSTFTVDVLERRGRGKSGHQRRTGYSLESEVDDARSVLDHTGSDLVFGPAMAAWSDYIWRTRPVRALVAYGPGVSIDGSFPRDFSRLRAPSRRWPSRRCDGHLPCRDELRADQARAHAQVCGPPLVLMVAVALPM